MGKLVMAKLKCMLILLILIMIAACNKLPPIENQTLVILPTQLRDGTIIYQSSDDLSRTQWWRKMHDAMLNHLIASALANNNDIKSSMANVMQAKAELKKSYYAWIPTLDGSANGFLTRSWRAQIIPKTAFANNPMLANIDKIKLQGYVAGFMPDYSFNILQNINSTKLAKASLQAQQADLQAIKLSIISQVSGAYFMLLSERAQLKLKQTLIRDQKKLRQLEKMRYKAGSIDIEAVVRLNQEIDQEESDIPKIRSTIAHTEDAIQLLLNQNPAPIRTDTNIMQLQVNNLVPSKLPSAVLQNRPDLMVAMNNVKIASADVGLAYSAFFPSFSLTNLIGSASVALTNILDLSAGFWLGQIASSMKMLNASAYADIKSTKAHYYSTYYAYIQTLRSVLADVDESLIAQKNAGQTLRLGIQAMYAAQKNYAIALIRYQAGATDYSPIINAKINLDQAKLNVVQQKAQVLDSIVQVYEAVGGGYNL